MCEGVYSIVSTRVIFTVITILIVLYLLSLFFPKKEGMKFKVGGTKSYGGIDWVGHGKWTGGIYDVFIYIIFIISIIYVVITTK